MSHRIICANCRLWDNSVTSSVADHSDTGRCVAKPPKADKRTGLAFWPFTDGDDWCGAYQENPELALEPPK